MLNSKVCPVETAVVRLHRKPAARRQTRLSSEEKNKKQKHNINHNYDTHAVNTFCCSACEIHPKRCE